MLELEFRGVSRRFADGGHALRDIDLVLPAGQLTTVLGPSGCGKSTLLRIAAGLEQPTTGQVLIGGCDVTDSAPGSRDLSMVFQSYALFPHLDVLGNVTFGLQASGMSSAEAAQRAGSALELVGLQGLEARATSALSGGQQQRVALARALALQPSVLLLDEPLSNLDVQLRRQVRDEIRSLQRRLGITMAYVTHDESEALALADFIVVMNDGRLLQTGTPREVYERPANDMVAAFLGDAEVFDATIGDDGSLMLGPLRLALSARSDTPVRVMVRPEAWRIRPASREGLAGRMSRCAYLGSHVEYHVDTELGLVLVKSSHAQALHQPGAPVSLTLASRGVMVWTATSPDTPAVSVSCHPEQSAPEAVLLQGEK
jgi:iron(III) transport system ATP-binding protein